MRRFWIALLAITCVAHVPFAAGLALALARLGAPHPWWIALAVAALLAAMVRGRVRRGRADAPIPPWKLLLIEEPYYAHWCAAVLSLPLLVITAPASIAFGSTLATAALAAYVIALAITTYGVVIRRRWVRVRTIDVEVPGLGAAFDGYRIAQLSDLHIGGLWSRDRARRWTEMVRRLDVDLVALTGDYVTAGDRFHEDIAAVLGDLRARDGAIAVLGNHDYFGDAEPLVARIRDRGVVVLRNEHHVLSRGSDSLVVAGVDDTWSRRADVARTLSGCPRGGALIALAHDPQLFPALARGGAGLVLSGHTHWGQIALPFAPERVNLSRLSYRYTAGLYTEGDATLYVSPGLGTTGPPIRVGAPPEITVLRLRHR